MTAIGRRTVCKTYSLRSALLALLTVASGLSFYFAPGSWHRRSYPANGYAEFNSSGDQLLLYREKHIHLLNSLTGNTIHEFEYPQAQLALFTAEDRYCVIAHRIEQVELAQAEELSVLRQNTFQQVGTNKISHPMRCYQKAPDRQVVYFLNPLKAWDIERNKFLFELDCTTDNTFDSGPSWASIRSDPFRSLDADIVIDLPEELYRANSLTEYSELIKTKNDRSIHAAAIISPSCRYIATNVKGTPIIDVWDGDTGVHRYQFHLPEIIRSEQMTFSPNSDWFGVGVYSANSNFFIFETKSGVMAMETRMPECNRVALFSDGKRAIAYSGFARTLYLEFLTACYHAKVISLPSGQVMSETPAVIDCSPDMTRFVAMSTGEDSFYIADVERGKRLFTLDFVHESEYRPPKFANNDIIQTWASDENDKDRTLFLWRRGHPEQWWGIAWLWQFWLAIAMSGMFLLSLISDVKYFRKILVSKLIN